MAKIFENQTGDGTSLIYPGVLQNNDELRWQGGPVQISMAGTFDGGTVVFEVDQNGLGFVSLKDTDFTQPDVNRMSLAKGSRLRATISGAGGSTDITVDVQAI